MKVASYPLVEKWLWVWIWLGDPEKADPALIPASRAERVTGYHNTFYFAEPFACNFQLVQDNLLDSTHVPFVHDDLLVGEVSDALREMAKPPLQIEFVGDTMNAYREMPDYRPGPTERATLGLEDKPYRYRLTTEITAPCMITSCSEWFELDGTPAVFLYYSLPVVPAGPRSCYHFMGVVVSHVW